MIKTQEFGQNRLKLITSDYLMLGKLSAC